MSCPITVARYYTPSGRSIQKPYEDKAENYFNEFEKRFESGELYEKDKTKIADSLKFKTKKGRIVYGGGGIIPTGTPPPGRVNEGGLGGEASGGDLNVDGTDGAMFYGEFPGAVPVRIIANASAGDSFYGVGAYSIASNTTPVTGVNGTQGAGGGSVS